MEGCHREHSNEEWRTTVHVKSRHYSDEVVFACDGIVRSIMIMQRHYLALAKEKGSMLQVLVHSDPGDSIRPHWRTSVVFNPRLFPW